tara:strand:- start:80 stop:571 length:492 start_codon:yes stop_codon:yes gene_type:complete
MNDIVLFDFNENVSPNEWIVVNDGVMGGFSSSKITVNSNGDGVFSGHVSLENNGGFCSVKYPLNSLKISKFNTFEIRIKGDGKKYQFRVKSKLNEYISYKFDFRTNGNWEVLKIPFKNLMPTFRGKMLDMSHFQNNIVEEIGFLISNKLEEDFILEIDYIKAL